MAEISLEISAKGLEVIRRLREFPAKAPGVIASVLNFQNEITVGYIQRTKLSERGPKTLGVVTGRLRRSLRPSKAVITGDGVESGIGSNVVYAGIHEFGFSGTVRVKEFLRRNPAGDRFSVNGSSPMGRQLIERLGLKKNQVKASQVSSGVSKVRAHSRRMNFPARAMIRSGIAERFPEYGKALEHGLLAAAGGVT